MSIDLSTGTPKRTKLSVNVSNAVSEHLRILAYKLRLSESSIVEVALKTLIVGADEEHLAAMLRQNGATLRSRS
jgi:hypothetical protein